MAFMHVTGERGPVYVMWLDSYRVMNRQQPY